MKLTNRQYDTIKMIGLVAVPVITFLVAIVNIWQIPYGDQIVATLAAVDVLIGAFVSVAKNIYDRKEKNIEDKTYY